MYGVMQASSQAFSHTLALILWIVLASLPARQTGTAHPPINVFKFLSRVREVQSESVFTCCTQYAVVSRGFPTRGAIASFSHKSVRVTLSLACTVISSAALVALVSPVQALPEVRYLPEPSAVQQVDKSRGEGQLGTGQDGTLHGIFEKGCGRLVTSGSSNQVPTAVTQALSDKVTL